MERPKHIAAFFLLLFLTIVPAAASWKAQIYEAYVGNRMDRWQDIIDIMEQEKVKEKEFLEQLINYQYGFIGWCLRNDKTDLAKEYLSKAEKNLDLFSDSNGDPSLVHAYESAFYGFKIGLSRMRAPVYGPRSIRHARLAMELDEDNPMGYIQYGNSQFYMPQMFGGSKEEAIRHFQKAEELMEQHPDALESDWNYLSLLTLIAQSYEEVGQPAEANSYYKKILRVEPNFSWVKNELYPEFLKKHKEYKHE